VGWKLVFGLWNALNNTMLSENHSGMETIDTTIACGVRFTLSENHSGMETYMRDTIAMR